MSNEKGIQFPGMFPSNIVSLNVYHKQYCALFSRALDSSACALAPFYSRAPEVEMA
jgi:hypothetical protein